MTSVLIGLALLLALVVATVALGALTRLLAAWIAGPSGRASRHEGGCEEPPITVLARIALGNELIARDLQPDATHPVARTADPEPRPVRTDGEAAERELARRYFFVATHRLS